jgi:hypothetical protein
LEEELEALRKHADMETGLLDEHKQQDRRTTHVSFDLEASVVHANSVQEAGQMVNHPANSRERLLQQLELCAENGIDGANWKNPDHDDWTPLMIAAINNNVGAAEIILNLNNTYGRYPGGQWDATNIFGETALHLIAKNKFGSSCSQIVKTIIEGYQLVGGSLFDISDNEEAAEIYTKILARRSNPHKRNEHTEVHSYFKFGVLATDWEKLNEGMDYVHDFKAENIKKCCGFNWPRVAKLFQFLDAPLMAVERFFDRAWMNGGHSVQEMSKLHGNAKMFTSLGQEISAVDYTN